MHLYMLSFFDICHFYFLSYFRFAPGKRHWKQSPFFQNVLNRFARFISMNFQHANYWITLEPPGSSVVSLPKNVINVYIFSLLFWLLLLKWSNRFFPGFLSWYLYSLIGFWLSGGTYINAFYCWTLISFSKNIINPFHNFSTYISLSHMIHIWMIAITLFWYSQITSRFAPLCFHCTACFQYDACVIASADLPRCLLFDTISTILTGFLTFQNSSELLSSESFFVSFFVSPYATFNFL